MAFWRFALILAVGVTAAAVPPASRRTDLANWSDPVAVAETVVPARPALVATSQAFLILWLDRYEGTVELRKAVLDERGIPTGLPTSLAFGADSQFGWPVAAAIQDAVLVAWMARSGGSVQLMGAVLGPTGDIVVPAQALAPPADEAGTVAMLPSGGRAYVAWSQFDHGQRRVWSLQLAADGHVERTARPIALGEAPALIVGEPLRLIWWQSVGFDRYRLMVSQLDDSGPTHEQSITPPILQGQVSPAFAAVGPDGLDMLVPIAERGFGTRERLYQLQLRGRTPTSRKVVPGVSQVSEFTGALVNGEPVAIWTTPTGRTSHLAVFAARFNTTARELDQPIRVNYTASGARFPTIAAGPNSFNSAWLEVAGLAHFRLVVATTQDARPRRFVFGIPELDLSRPVQFSIFVGTVLLTILPYALIYVAGFSIVAFVITGLGLILLGSFAWKEPLDIRPRIRLVLFVVAAVALETLSRSIIPGVPAVRLLVGALALPGIAIALLARGREVSSLRLWAIAALALLVQMLVVLFPWGVAQLSQS